MPWTCWRCCSRRRDTIARSAALQLSSGAPGARLPVVSTSPKAAPAGETVVEEDDPIVRSIENAPLDAEALTAEEAAELDARLARPLGSSFSTADVLARIAERAKTEE